VLLCAVDVNQVRQAEEEASAVLEEDSAKPRKRQRTSQAKEQEMEEDKDEGRQLDALLKKCRLQKGYILLEFLVSLSLSLSLSSFWGFGGP